MEQETEGRIIQGLDLIDVLTFVGKKNKRFQAVMLGELEMILDPKSDDFRLVRKLILDYWNSYTRSILRVIFGDIEFDRYKR